MPIISLRRFSVGSPPTREDFVSLADLDITVFGSHPLNYSASTGSCLRRRQRPCVSLFFSRIAFLLYATFFPPNISRFPPTFPCFLSMNPCFLYEVSLPFFSRPAETRCPYFSTTTFPQLPRGRRGHKFFSGVPIFPSPALRCSFSPPLTLLFCLAVVFLS